MFIVLNKEKIRSYIVAFCTVIALFILAGTMTNRTLNTVQVSANVQKMLPIYQVQTEEKKIALTMNCAW